MNEFENVDPETVTLPTPIRSARTAVDGRPRITRFTIERRGRTHLVVNLHEEDRTIRVPRATPTTPPRDAVQAFLNGGVA